MEQDLLSQLRDIHLPQAPPWWPPAPGWWVSAALALCLLAWGLVELWRRWQSFRPARTARQLHRRLTLEMREGSITPTAWLHGINEVLKRLAVHGLGHREMIPAWGDDWLRYLDGRYGERAFSQGAGRCLGQSRFRRNAEVDVQALEGLISNLLDRECRRFWRFSLSGASRREPSGRPGTVRNRWPRSRMPAPASSAIDPGKHGANSPAGAPP